jgi:uncharacterized protein YhaN
MLECGPGLNVIHGRNDAGKSTIHLAFSAVLYPIRPSEVKTYGTWGEGDPGEITVEFDVGACSYRLRKDFGTRRVVLEGAGATIEDPRHVEQRVGELLGLASLSLFRATVHISQWDLAGVQKEQQEIGTRLARIMTGGDADAARVLSMLDDRIRRLEVGLQRPAKTPGPLKADQDRLAHLSAEQQRLTREVEAIERAAAERDRLVTQIGALEQQVRDHDELLKANRRLLELETYWTQMSARAKELASLLDRVDRAALEVEAADRDEAVGLSATDLRAVRRLQDADARARVLEEAIGQSAAPEPAADPAAPGSVFDLRHLAPGGAGLGLLALLAAVAGMTLLGAGKTAWGATAVGVALALTAAAVAVQGRRVRRGAQETMIRAERELLVRQAEERRAAAEGAAEEVRKQLRALRVPSVQAAVELAQRWERVRLRQASAHNLLSELLGGRTREAIAQEHQQALLDLGMIRAQREEPDLVLRQLDPAGFQRLQAEAASRKSQLTDAVGALHRLEGRLGGGSPHEELARVEEEITETHARLARYQRFGEVLKLTRAVLFEAHRGTIVPGKALLEERAGRYLRELSGGVYARVAVDEHTLAPRVWVGPPKGWAEVASREIGSGAVDQCYLALRLALVDVLCNDHRPPLFLDDPFLAYDEYRERAAMGFLRQFARDRQVFLLTCRGQYHQYADRLIVLGEAAPPAPAAKAPSASVIPGG